MSKKYISELITAQDDDLVVSYIQQKKITLEEYTNYFVKDDFPYETFKAFIQSGEPLSKLLPYKEMVEELQEISGYYVRDTEVVKYGVGLFNGVTNGKIDIDVTKDKLMDVFNYKITARLISKMHTRKGLLVDKIYKWLEDNKSLRWGDIAKMDMPSSFIDEHLEEYGKYHILDILRVKNGCSANYIYNNRARILKIVGHKIDLNTLYTSYSVNAYTVYFTEDELLMLSELIELKGQAYGGVTNHYSEEFLVKFGNLSDSVILKSITLKLPIEMTLEDQEELIRYAYSLTGHSYTKKKRGNDGRLKNWMF